MRVSSGILGGMEIRAPRGLETRPTSAKIREAVMSALHHSIEGARILDLFAGTGAFSWEAISRGGRMAVLVEQSVSAAKVIQENRREAERRFGAQGLDFPEFHLINLPVANAFKSAAVKGPFDIVWADPPYKDAMDFLDLILKHLGPMLSPAGELILETDKSNQHDVRGRLDRELGWQLYKQRAYGNTMIHRIHNVPRG